MPEVTAWCHTNPKLQKTYDAYSLSSMVCMRKYYYSVVEGYREKDESVHLTFGLHIHTGIQTYWRERSKGADKNTALRAAVRAVMEASYGWESPDKRKARWTLIRTVIWYAEEYDGDNLTIIDINGEPAIEVSFRIPLPKNSPDGDPYLLVGYFDGVGDLGGGMIVLPELKSTTRGIESDYYWKDWNPNTQISTYNLAQRVILPNSAKGVLIIAMQLGVGFTRFGRKLIRRTKDHADEHLKNILTKIEEAEKCAREDYWPMDESACALFNGCQFRGVCAKTGIERRVELQKKFDRKGSWDPMMVR